MLKTMLFDIYYMERTILLKVLKFCWICENNFIEPLKELWKLKNDKHNAAKNFDILKTIVVVAIINLIQ